MADQQLRWDLAGDRPQGELFEPIVEREFGRGEFRGMEFLHVEARRIINEIKGEARFGFSHTINAYRGCSHACTYCLVGETPILMADGRAKRLAEVEVGDRIYGTAREGRVSHPTSGVRDSSRGSSMPRGHATHTLSVSPTRTRRSSSGRIARWSGSASMQ